MLCHYHAIHGSHYDRIQGRYHPFICVSCTAAAAHPGTRDQPMSAKFRGGSSLLQQTAAPTADVRVATALQEAQLKYEIDQDGDYRLLIDYSEEGRSQLVWANSKTYTLGDALEVREVWSVAYEVPTVVPVTLANQLLQRNFEQIIGTWQIMTINGGSYVVFTAKVPADLAAEQLAAVVYAVAETADDFEIEMMVGDDF